MQTFTRILRMCSSFRHQSKNKNKKKCSGLLAYRLRYMTNTQITTFVHARCCAFLCVFSRFSPIRLTLFFVRSLTSYPPPPLNRWYILVYACRVLRQRLAIRQFLSLVNIVYQTYPAGITQNKNNKD